MTCRLLRVRRDDVENRGGEAEELGLIASFYPPRVRSPA
jgi:hypothetical protein